MVKPFGWSGTASRCSERIVLMAFQGDPADRGEFLNSGLAAEATEAAGFDTAEGACGSSPTVGPLIWHIPVSRRRATSIARITSRLHRPGTSRRAGTRALQADRRRRQPGTVEALVNTAGQADGCHRT